MKYSKYNYNYYNLWYSIKCYTCEIVTTMFYFLSYNIKYIFSGHCNVNYNKDDIIFFTSYGHMPGNIQWDGNSLDKGIGGSEYCVIKLAESMAKDVNVDNDNKHIIVYCDCKQNCIINNVYYIKSDLFDYSIKYNNIIIWRLPFIEWFTKYKNLVLWVHDGSLIPALDFFNWIKTLKYFINPNINIVVPSKYIYDEFKKYNIYEKVFNINHGFEKYNGNIQEQDQDRIKNSFIWHVNLNRGLDTLLNNFHLILHEFPSSKIYICGEDFAYYNKNNHYISSLLSKFEKCIVYTNKLKHNKLLELLNKCDFFCYTGNIVESFSLSTWEAAINGCIPIVYDIGALSEIKEVGGIVIEHNNVNLFFNTLLDLMHNGVKKEQLRENIINNVIHDVNYKWDDVKKMWYRIIV